MTKEEENRRLESIHQARERIEEARRVLRRDYWQSICGMVEEIKVEIRDGTIVTAEDCSRWLWDTTGGSSRVIHPNESIEVLLFSDNDGAYLEEFGADGLVTDGVINWGAMAQVAMERDIVDKCFEEGIDPSNPSALLEEEDDEDA